MTPQGFLTHGLRHSALDTSSGSPLRLGCVCCFFFFLLHCWFLALTVAVLKWASQVPLSGVIALMDECWKRGSCLQGLGFIGESWAGQCVLGGKGLSFLLSEARGSTSKTIVVFCWLICLFCTFETGSCYTSLVWLLTFNSSVFTSRAGFTGMCCHAQLERSKREEAEVSSWAKALDAMEN